MNLPRPIGRSRLLRGRQLLRRRIGDRGRLDLGAPDLPSQLTSRAVSTATNTLALSRWRVSATQLEAARQRWV
jgi:hypothetical protein